MLVGVGEPKTLNAREWMEIGGVVRGKLPAKTKEADVMFDGVDSLNGEAPLSFALGFGLKNYAFKKYKSKGGSRSDAEDSEAEHERTSPRLTVFSHSARATRARFSEGSGSPQRRILRAGPRERASQHPDAAGVCRPASGA